MKFNKFYLFFFLATGFSAMAEQGCPPGQIPAQANGAITSCGPIPTGYYQQQEQAAPRPVGKWIKTWGAVAQDTANGTLGVSVGKSSRREARDEARAKCIEVGGVQCKNWVDYENQCVAIAGPQKNGANTPGKLQYAQGPSIDSIRRNAVEGCTSTNKLQCGLLYSACSEPILRRY